jgi:hypothetical protein
MRRKKLVLKQYAVAHIYADFLCAFFHSFFGYPESFSEIFIRHSSVPPALQQAQQPHTIHERTVAVMHDESEVEKMLGWVGSVGGGLWFFVEWVEPPPLFVVVGSRHNEFNISIQYLP